MAAAIEAVGTSEQAAIMRDALTTDQFEDLDARWRAARSLPIEVLLVAYIRDHALRLYPIADDRSEPRHVSPAARELLRRSEPWSILVLQYDTMHSSLRLALHDGDYPMCTEIICLGVDSFKGHMQAGPLHLAVDQANDDVVISDPAKQFVVHCWRVHRGSRRGIRAE